jgi:hypothetical protein
MIYPSRSEQAWTSVTEYRHPERIGKITLVGAVHLGSPDYYDQLQGVIDNSEQAGAIVHHEGIQPASPEELSAATPKDQAKERRFNRMLALIEEKLYVSTAFNGLVRQSEAIRPGKNWQCHDATSLQVVQAADDRELYAMSRQIREAANPSPATLALARAVESAMAKIFGEPDDDENREIRNLLASLNDRDDEQPYWMGGLREGIQLGAVDEHVTSLPDTDLTLVWGEKHVPNFNTGLYNRGYEAVNEQQLLAIDLRQLTNY